MTERQDIAPDVERESIEGLEIDLLLEAIFRRWGYDFRSYARASIERRIRRFLSMNGGGTVAGMIPRVLHDDSYFSQLVRSISVTVTEFFRDPQVYKVFRERVVPMLKTWPHIKIWHAGCATGEEVYSLAVILREEGLYDHATIYATDFNDASIAKAKAGIYKLGNLQEASENYYASGGNHSFSDYYYARYGAAAIDSSLKQRIVFANHNLVSDGVFGEMNLIFCRNVLIYFNAELKSRVLTLFADSLTRGGYLCLGTREALQFTSVEDAFELVDMPSRIYRFLGERGES